MNDATLYGRKRPARGPYPKGVINGPNPTTKRGWKRRKANTQGIKPDEVAKPGS